MWRVQFALALYGVFGVVLFGVSHAAAQNVPQVDDWVLRTEWLVAMRQYERAYGVTSRECFTHPNSSLAHAYSGFVQFLMGFPDRGHVHLQRAVELAPLGKIENAMMAILLTENGDPAAGSHLKTVLNSKPSGSLENTWIERVKAFYDSTTKSDDGNKDTLTAKIRAYGMRREINARGAKMSGSRPVLHATIGFDDYLATVHTATRHTFLDYSLLPTLPESTRIGIRKASHNSSNMIVEFPPPQIRIADKTRVQPDRVYLMDLEGPGFEPYPGCGVMLGLDAVKHIRFILDYAKGETKLIHSAPSPVDWDAQLPLRMADEGLYLDLLVDGARHEFLVDTSSLESCVLGSETDGAEYGGAEYGAWGRKAVLEIGGVKVKNVIVKPTADGKSSVGLGFLNRFRLCFDFPGKKLYVSRGKHIDAIDPSDAYGVRMLQTTGGLKVEALQKDGAAQRAGVKLGDLIVGFKGVRYGNDLAVAAKLLSLGKKTALIRRGTEELTIDLP